jgi:hypothetical protein
MTSPIGNQKLSAASCVQSKFVMPCVVMCSPSSIPHKHRLTYACVSPKQIPRLSLFQPLSIKFTITVAFPCAQGRTSAESGSFSRTLHWICSGSPSLHDLSKHLFQHHLSATSTVKHSISPGPVSTDMMAHQPRMAYATCKGGLMLTPMMRHGGTSPPVSR